MLPDLVTEVAAAYGDGLRSSATLIDTRRRQRGKRSRHRGRLHIKPCSAVVPGARPIYALPTCKPASASEVMRKLHQGGQLVQGEEAAAHVC